jgi:branched-chain amino acid transport system substrate-binding protein
MSQVLPREDRDSPTTTAALTLSLTGPYRRQGSEAAEGVRLWARHAGVRLALVDDGGSAATATEAYAGWLGNVDLLIGPYASGLVRRISPLIRSSGQLLWNHGGSADDLAQPGIVCLPAPASTYLHGVVDEAIARGIARLVIVQGTGPFARAVTDGASTRALDRGLDVQTVDAAAIDDLDASEAGLLVVGSFEHDTTAVQRLRHRRPEPTLVAAVAAGIQAFGRELGGAAEGILGPVQWWPNTSTPRIGPSGADFATTYRDRTGHEPSYVAVQAAAAGYLAHAAHRLSLTAENVQHWSTSTMLGTFQLDGAWRQVGHRVSTIRWHNGQMVLLSANTEP